MAIDINKLLALPQRERRKIAETLWGSLAPVNSISKEDKKIIAILDKRWDAIQSGKSKLYTPDQLRKMIASHRGKSK